MVQYVNINCDIQLNIIQKLKGIRYTESGSNIDESQNNYANSARHTKAHFV